MELYLTALGTVNAFNTVTVRSRVDGELIKVAFTEGQTVKQGQLWPMDPRPYKVASPRPKDNSPKTKRCCKTRKLDLKRYLSLESTRVITEQQIDLQRATSSKPPPPCRPIAQ